MERWRRPAGSGDMRVLPRRAGGAGGVARAEERGACRAVAAHANEHTTTLFGWRPGGGHRWQFAAPAGQAVAAGRLAYIVHMCAVWLWLADPSGARCGVHCGGRRAWGCVRAGRPQPVC